MPYPNIYQMKEKSNVGTHLSWPVKNWSSVFVCEIDELLGSGIGGNFICMVHCCVCTHGCGMYSYDKGGTLCFTLI